MDCITKTHKNFNPKQSTVCSIFDMGYRYGYNKQEKDNEIGLGHFTAEFWEYNSSLGRRWNLDPISSTDENEYVVNGNNPIYYVDPKGDFKTKFGAKFYNFLNGGGGEVRQAGEKDKNHAGEWFVGKRVKYNGNYSVGATYQRKFGWENKTVTKTTDAVGNFVEKSEFTVEGKAKFSIGVQIGASGNLWGIQGKAEAGLATFDIAEAKYDLTKMKGAAGLSENRVHNFIGVDAKLLSDKLRIGGKYDYTFLYSDGYYGPRMVKDSDIHDWTANLPFKSFGPKVKIVDNIIATQVKASANIGTTNGKVFYGLDIGAGAKLILGVDLKLKLGFNY